MFDVFKDPLFVFDEEKHLYTYDDVIFPSVSNVIKRFHAPFDELGKATKKANDEGRTVGDVLAEWANTRNSACTLGHIVHDYIERKQKGLNPDLPSDLEAQKRIALYEEFWAANLASLEFVGAELRVFSKKWKIAGTIDALYKHPKTGKLYILDWKTNKEFETEAITRTKPWANTKGMYYPFQDHLECHETKYSIQLSCYRLILAEYGIDVAGCGLIHISRNGTAAFHKVLDFRPHLTEYFSVFA